MVYNMDTQRRGRFILICPPFIYVGTPPKTVHTRLATTYHIFVGKCVNTKKTQAVRAKLQHVAFIHPTAWQGDPRDHDEIWSTACSSFHLQPWGATLLISKWSKDVKSITSKCRPWRRLSPGSTARSCTGDSSSSSVDNTPHRSFADSLGSLVPERPHGHVDVHGCGPQWRDVIWISMDTIGIVE